MYHLSRMTTAGAALVATALLVGGCGSGSGDSDGAGSSGDGGADAPKLFATDFQPVCSGATESRAADYASATTHKALYFETYEEDLLDQSSSLPADWTVLFDENADVYAQVDVVACAVRTADEPARTCDGYEDDDSGATVTVNWHTATYELTVYEARTGTELGATTIEADDDECPSFITFDEGQTEIDMYAAPTDDEVVQFLKPFVQP